MRQFRAGARFREGRFSGFRTGLYIPLYIALEKRGYKVTFYNPADLKVGELGSDIQQPAISHVEFEIHDFGCGAFRMITDDKIPFSIDYRTRVDIAPYFSTDPWYTGFILIMPQKSQTRKPYEYGGFGYFEQLGWIRISGDYASQDASAIVANIVEYQVAPSTYVKYNPSKIATSGKTVSEISFDYVPGKSAFQTLADLAVGFEFGVDNFREFYFRERDAEIRETLWATKHYGEFSIDENVVDLRNRLYVKGGQIIEGSNIIGSVEDADSIAAYGIHEDIITAPEILNTDDALAWAQEVLLRKSEPKRTGHVENVFLDQLRRLIEAKGKARITDENGEEFILPIRSVRYRISPAGTFATLELESPL